MIAPSFAHGPFPTLPTGIDPVVVVSSGHAGSRFIAEALQKTGIFMGADLNAVFDSLSWHEDFAVPLMRSKWFPVDQPDEWPNHSEFRDFLDERLHVTIERFTGGRLHHGPWGWKGSTLFVTPLIERAFPAMRMLHIIRDGRDVVLSQDGMLNLPFHRPPRRRHPVKRFRQTVDDVLQRRSREDYQLKVFFGRADLKSWNGLELDRATVYDSRYLLQMQSWIRHIDVARQYGARFGERYLEIQYEELCRRPREVLRQVTEWLGIPATHGALSYVGTNAFVDSIGKWQHIELPADRAADFERAALHGRAVLSELGYQVG